MGRLFPHHSTIFPGVYRGEIRGSVLKARVDLKRMQPDRNYGLGVAKVMNIDYEDFFVTLRTLTGVDQIHDRVPIPITFPGAGKRHFFGSMPEIGDYCIVGWMPTESANPDGTKIPVILSWVVPGPWMGREWVTGSDFEISEYDFDSQIDQEFVLGVHDRTRYKLRHMQPGNIVASSSQGADLVLDEGVTLANRRGNEFRLRDQDQAAVLRALQSFQALAGARTYTGMVQRDALFLNRMVVSDGYEWDGPLQSLVGQPLNETQLPVDVTAPEDFLVPSRFFRKLSKGNTDDEGHLGRAVVPTKDNIDPYMFLRHGGFITEAGFVVDDKWAADTEYGGKPIFRVAAQSAENAAKNPDAPTLTEHRIEVSHTSDGRLPVTEQTDLLDAERLPRTDPMTGSLVDFPPNWPFMEFVMGSVVGNDAFTEEGRNQYGLPLVAKIFDGNQGNPRLVGATFVTEDSPLAPTPLGQQLASLFRLTPPIVGGGPPTFWGVNKNGQLRASIGGDPKQNSVEAYLRGGLKLGVAGAFNLIMDGHLGLGTKGKESMDLRAEEGAVVIYGGGPLKDNEATVSRMTGTDGGEGDLPSVAIEARTNARLRAEKKVTVKGNKIVAEASNTLVNGLQNLELKGGEGLSISTKSYQKTINGRAQESWSGPKNNLPTNGPLHSRDYSPTVPTQVAEKITYNSGHREEKFVMGDHTTKIVVGDLTHTLLEGTWKAQAFGTTMKMNNSGLKGDALVGSVKLSAAAGAATMSGQTGVTIKSLAGTAKVQSTQQVQLAAPITGPDQGAIICEGSKEPFTNKPFSTWGLGAKKHLVVAG